MSYKTYSVFKTTAMVIKEETGFNARKFKTTAVAITVPELGAKLPPHLKDAGWKFRESDPGSDYRDHEKKICGDSLEALIALRDEIEACISASETELDTMRADRLNVRKHIALFYLDKYHVKGGKVFKIGTEGDSKEQGLIAQ